MNQVYSNKNALITGATGGLGEQVALKLAQKGCNLHLTGRNNEKLKKLAQKIKNFHVDVDFTAVDFCSVQQVQDFLKKDVSVDILVNCAGTFPIKNLCESTLEDYEVCFDINVKAPFILSKKFAEYMKEKGWGRIVNVASSSAYNGSADTGLYCASKHALLGLSRSLYQELKPYNIRVFTVSPGSIQTEMGATDTRQDFSTFLNPEEIADYIIYVMKFDSGMISEEIRLNRVLVR